MKTVKLTIMAMLFACITVTMAHAGTQVLMNQSAAVKAEVKNTTSRSVTAAVKLTGYDDAGTAIGHLCQNTYLRAERTTTVEFAWQAPNYPTGVYWASKVEPGVLCPSTAPTYDHDDDEHDDDEHEH